MHIGEISISSFLTKCNHCGCRNLLWTLFISVTGLLEAFKETAEGAKFFKEEARKGTVCVYIHILGQFCLPVWVSFCQLSDETLKPLFLCYGTMNSSQTRTLLRDYYQPTGQQYERFNWSEMKLKHRIPLGSLVTDLEPVFLTVISKASQSFTHLKI